MSDVTGVSPRTMLKACGKTVGSRQPPAGVKLGEASHPNPDDGSRDIRSTTVVTARRRGENGISRKFIVQGKPG